MKYLLAIPAIFWIIASAIVFAYGEYLSKKFSLAPSWKAAFFVAFVYAIDALLWLPAILQKKQLVATTLVWTVMSLVAIAAVGFFVFGEKLSSVGILGALLAVVSIFLLSF